MAIMKCRMKKSLPFFILMAALMPSSCSILGMPDTVIVSGRIWDDSTIGPLENVNVVLKHCDVFGKLYGETFYARTNSEGKFSVRVMEADWYILTASKAGYDVYSDMLEIYSLENGELPLIYLVRTI
jgi:hypothetical protein